VIRREAPGGAVMQVAVLGTGKMGAAMARRLAGCGHDVTVWNRTRARAEAVGAAKVASTPAEAVRDADVVISILTDAAAVRNVYLGNDGALKAARKQVFVEMSTAGPDVVKEIAPAVEKAGAKFIECPVMGSIPAIDAGKGMLIAAGDDEALEKARPVLECIGEVRRVKDAESAAKLKLVANTMLTGVSALAAEVLTAARAAGLDPEDVFWIFTRFAPVLAARKSGYVDHQFQPVTFALRDAAKDVKLAAEVFERAGAEVPLTKVSKELYERAAKTMGDQEMSAIVTVFEKQPLERKR
jgi:3-hydroxyisobutyrate dehydrogenase-like beta-hydroxyacid dehydrogenase